MRPTVLVVDDSPIIRELLQLALHEAGFAVVEAEDGEAATALLQRQAPQVIVSDLSMPRMDGLALLDHLRSQPAQGRIPVLMLTVETQPEARAAARSHGASAFMNKPCRAPDLVSAVVRLCEQHGIAVPAPRQAAA